MAAGPDEAGPRSGGLDLPPLLSDVAVTPDVDPFEAATAAAREGIDGGTVFWAVREDRLEAALALAPETALRPALTVTFALQQALTDAIGAYAPPETAAFWAWPDVFLLNRGRVGRLRVAASSDDPEATPDWLVFGLSVRHAPRDASDPGVRPDETCLTEEGLGDLSTRDLAGAWARHALYWITRWQDEGLAAVMREWRGRAEGEGGAVRVALGPEGSLDGRWLGLDDDGALTVKTADGARRLDLARVLTPAFVDPGADPLDRAAALTARGASGPTGGEALRKRAPEV